MLTGRAGGLARAAAGLAGPRGPGAVRGRAGRCGPSASGLPPALPLPPVWQGPPRPPLAVDPLPRASVNGSRRGPGPGGCGLSRPSRPRRCRGPGGALRGLGLRPSPRPPSPSRLAGPPAAPLAVDPRPRASVKMYHFAHFLLITIVHCTIVILSFSPHTVTMAVARMHTCMHAHTHTHTHH